MSNEIMELDVSKLPALGGGLLDSLLKMTETALTGAGGAFFPRLSTAGKQWTIVRGGEEPSLVTEEANGKQYPVQELEVVTIAWNPGRHKAFYAKGYDQKAKEHDTPVCWSLTGETPHPSVEQPQAKRCADCPKNVFGSKITENGKKAKACNDSKRLLVVPPTDIDGEIFLVNVSATALAGWDSYVKTLASRRVPPCLVKTRLSFQKDSTVPVLQFTFMGLLSESDMKKVLTRMEEPNVKEFMGGTYDDESEAPRQNPNPVREEAPTSAPVAEKPKAAKGFGGASKPAPAQTPAPAAPEATGGDDVDAILADMFS